MQTLTITRPDDWHLHLRDGAAMKDALVHTSAVFARAIVMPNLKPPVTRTDQARAYRERIVSALAPGPRPRSGLRATRAWYTGSSCIRRERPRTRKAA